MTAQKAVPSCDQYLHLDCSLVPACALRAIPYAIPGNAVTNTVGEVHLRREAQLAARSAYHEAIVTGYLLQPKPHDRWWLLHPREVADDLTGCAQGESEAVGNVPLGQRYTQLPGDAAEIL